MIDRYWETSRGLRVHIITEALRDLRQYRADITNERVVQCSKLRDTFDAEAHARQIQDLAEQEARLQGELDGKSPGHGATDIVFDGGLAAPERAGT